MRLFLGISLLSLVALSTPALADVADAGSSDGGADDGGGGAEDDGGGDDDDDNDGCGGGSATSAASVGLGLVLLAGLKRRRR